MAAAPHIDQKQRGFSPCTYQMAETFQYSSDISFWQTVMTINKGYLCYASVMWQGFKLFVKGEQKTPWANYMFEPELEEIPFEEDGEPFSEDLLKANMLDEEIKNTDLSQDVMEENQDEAKQ